MLALNPISDETSNRHPRYLNLELVECQYLQVEVIKEKKINKIEKFING